MASGAKLTRRPANFLDVDLSSLTETCITPITVLLSSFDGFKILLDGAKEARAFRGCTLVSGSGANEKVLRREDKSSFEEVFFAMSLGSLKRGSIFC